MTQLGLAERYNVSVSTIRRIVRGDSYPDAIPAPGACKASASSRPNQYELTKLVEEWLEFKQRQLELLDRTEVETDTRHQGVEQEEGDSRHTGTDSELAS